MSRVTVKELYWEVHASIKSWEDAKDIEVVPRKMVEIIIEKCIRDESESAYSNATQEEAADIRKYAESLLKQFEEPEPTAEYDPLPFD